MADTGGLQEIARTVPVPAFDIPGNTLKKRHCEVAVIPSKESYNPEVSQKITPPKAWDPDVRVQVSSEVWLQKHSLKKNRLDSQSIYPSIGFKQLGDYDKILKKPVSSKYGETLFVKHFREDGKTFNITARKDQLETIQQQLEGAINMYRSRLDWLTSESRRIFGVIQEHCVCIILDIKNLSPRQFDQYLCSMERVLKEQVVNLAKFNIIRCAEEIQCFSTDPVAVTHDVIELAVDWLWKLDRLAPTGSANTVEAVIRANIAAGTEAIYLFSEGNSSDGSREVLRDKVRQLKMPFHIISYNCTGPDTMQFLKSLCDYTGGRFHAYAVTMEMDSYEGLPVDNETHKANIVVRKRLYGGVPSGAGQRPDCLLIFQELEEARNIHGQILNLINQTPDPKPMYDTAVEHDTVELHDRQEEYMSSKEWVEKFGLKPRRLDFFDVLQGCCFKHCDGVVDVMRAPELEEVAENEKVGAIVRPKLINAKYCDKFAHVRWKDGGLVHVQMTNEVHRLYEKRMKVFLEAVKRRIDWMRQGSRELFGTIVEEQIYILIDTSSSLEPSIGFIKDKLFVLMQEQLRHKAKINFVAFNTKAYPWKDRLVDVTEPNLQAAWMWVKGLTCYGSSNTLDALKFALSDRQTHAVYLLTDGRPDHPPKTVLAQVQLHNKVPIHTISFNCSDDDANQFLCTLAKETGGRFHYFSENVDDPAGPEPWESEDIRILKEEHTLGMTSVERVAQLRDECHRLAWNQDTYGPNVGTLRVEKGEISTLESSRSYPFQPHMKCRRRGGPSGRRRVTKRAQKEKPSLPVGDKKVVMTTLNQKDETEEWILPETREVLDRQEQRFRDKMEEERRKKISESPRSPRKHHEEPESIRAWLKVYGLKSQRLTILDALAPTVVKQKPSYIDVIDKTVLSKVFDDILPIAHVSNQDKRTLRLVHPEAVDLTCYIKKLTPLISKFEKKWMHEATKEMSEEAMDNILDESGDIELSYEKHREDILRSLEEAEWPVSEIDLTMLSNEIRTAYKYLRQAEALSNLHRNTLKGNGESYEGMSALLQNNQSKRTKVKPTLDSLKGQRVIARDANDGFYYAGHVVRCPDLRMAEVQFFDQTKTVTVPTRFCIPISGAIARPMLQVCDCVLMRVSNKDNGRVCYVPGKITALPVGAPGEARSYTVRLFTGVRHQTLRGDIVKVGEARYNFIVQSIRNKLEDQEAASEESSNLRPSTKSDSHHGRDPEFKLSQEGNSSSSVQLSESTVGSRDGARDRRVRRKPPQSKTTASDYNVSSSAVVEREDSQSGANASRDKRGSHDDRDSKDTKSRSKKSRDKRSSPDDRERRGSDQRRDSASRQVISLLENQSEKLMELDRKLAEQTTYMNKQQKKLRLKLRKIKVDAAEAVPLQPLEGKLQDHDAQIRQIQEELAREHEDDRPPSRQGRRPSDEIADVMSASDVRAQSDEQAKESRVDGKRSSSTFKEDIEVGEEVLARWLDDGWYYRGIVKRCLGDGSYQVQDGATNQEVIWREDIIREEQDGTVELETGSTLVALHPSYSASYAPGVVVSLRGPLSALVRFYDGEEARLPREECYPIPQGRFESVVSYITDAERQWVGQAVVARNEDASQYQMGQVMKRVGNGKQYVIEWSDGSLGVQCAGYIFGSFTRRHVFRQGDRLLACADRQKLIYLPGWVTRVGDMDKMSVRFCNGKRLDDVDPIHSFWLSQDYYDQAVAYHKEKKKI